MTSRNAGLGTVGAWIAAVAMVFAAGACSKKDEEAAAVEPPPDKSTKQKRSGGEGVRSDDEPATATATAEPTSLPETGETELDSVAMPSAADCVRQCVDRNQMRAVGADQILADCKSSCRKDCVERCDELAETRSGRFGEVCRKDCDAQVGEADQD
ncbi:MAG: hypothetical protein JRI23_09385 [Deltaproteobacteria bacterium]|jgi:hypothetical protein|nr:hypothetical protein [Deltaproteobacteria bacterium]MBW2531861.1 hypothetical protein [Deltaproteobacteria bacterium]